MEPLFFASRDGVVVFGNHLGDIVDAFGANRPDLNWEHLYSFIAASVSDPNTTPFMDIHAVPQNTILSFTGTGVSQRVHWNPWTARRSDAAADPARLRETLVTATRSWIGDSKKAVVRLSGGLDSAGIAWAAKQSGREVVGVHFDQRTRAEAVEVEYAQAVAKALNVDLTVVNVDEHGIFSQPPPKLLSRPNVLVPAILCGPELAVHLSYLDDDSVLLSGGGGDQVSVAQQARPFELHDIFLQRGFREWWRAALAWSRAGAAPVTTLIAEVCRYERARRQDQLLAKVMFEDRRPRWLDPSVIPKGLSRRSMFANVLGDIPPVPAGALLHIVETLVAMSNIDPHLSCFAGHNVEYPLLSRPFVELMFQMPVPSLINAEKDRIVFRDALTGYIPDEVRLRRSKAGISGSVQLAMRKQFTYASELIAEGVIARSGALDVPLVLRHLRAYADGMEPESSSLLNLLAAETWLRYWGYT